MATSSQDPRRGLVALLDDRADGGALDRVLRVVEAVSELPAPQRAVLLPLLAWTIVESAPKGAAVPPAVQEFVAEFRDTLAAHSPSQSEALLRERLDAAGVCAETFRSLLVQVGLVDATPMVRALLATPIERFVARAAPAAGQFRAGVLARHSMAAVSSRTPKEA